MNNSTNLFVRRSCTLSLSSLNIERADDEYDKRKHVSVYVCDCV